MFVDKRHRRVILSAGRRRPSSIIFLGIWLAASLVLGALWALAGWLLGRRRVDPIAAEFVEAEAEEEAA